MKQEDLEYIIANHKWPVDWWDIRDRYYVLLFPAFLFFLSIGMPIGIGLVQPVMIFSLFLLSVSSYFFYHIYKRIKMERTFYFMASPVCQKATIETYIWELDWEIIKSNNQYLQARTKLSRTSWGEVITIIFLGNQILFNSRPDSQPFTGIRDNVNFMKLFDLITANEQAFESTQGL